MCWLQFDIKPELSGRFLWIAALCARLGFLRETVDSRNALQSNFRLFSEHLMWCDGDCRISWVSTLFNHFVVTTHLDFYAESERRVISAAASHSRRFRASTGDQVVHERCRIRLHLLMLLTVCIACLFWLDRPKTAGHYKSCLAYQDSSSVHSNNVLCSAELRNLVRKLDGALESGLSV